MIYTQRLFGRSKFRPNGVRSHHVVVRERHVDEQVSMQSVVCANGLAQQGFVKVHLYWGEPASCHGEVAWCAGVGRLRAGSRRQGGTRCLYNARPGPECLIFRLALWLCVFLKDLVLSHVF